MAEVEFKVSTSPIATIIGGLGSAIGGIGNAVGGAAKLAGNTIETIGDIAKAGSAAGGDAPNRTVNESNLGLVAAAAQQSVKGKGGSGTLPARKTATKQKPSQNLSTEKLLSIAVKHLTSIDASLKAQMDYNVQATREEAKQEKENDIEGKNSVFTRFADRMKMKAANAAGAVKEKGMGFAQTAAMVAAAALVMKLSSLKPETIERLKKTITEFQDKYKFLFEEVFPILSGAFAGARLGARAGPWGAFIGAIGGGLLAWGWIAEEKRQREQRKEQDAARESAKKSPDSVKTAWNAYIDAVKVYQDRKDLPGGSKENGSIIADAVDKISKARPVLEKAMKEAGYSEKQIATATSLEFQEKVKDLDKAMKEIGAPENAPKQDATKASGAIPAAYYDVAWNEGRDLKPPKPLTQMSVDEVMAYQGELFKKTGHTPTGAFQITKETLEDAKKNGIVKGTALYNPETQDKIARDLFEKRKSGNLKETWAALPNSEKGYYKDYTFDQMKKEISERELGKTPSSPMAEAVGSTLTAAGSLRESMVSILADQNKNLERRNPDGKDTLTKQMAVDQKADEIRQQAIALENSMRGDAKKEEDRKNAAAQMSPGAKLAKANQGKMEALDPNYKTDSNNIISKYFVYFGLAA